MHFVPSWGSHTRSRVISCLQMTMASTQLNSRQSSLVMDCAGFSDLRPQQELCSPGPAEQLSW